MRAWGERSWEASRSHQGCQRLALPPTGASANRRRRWPDWQLRGPLAECPALEMRWGGRASCRSRGAWTSTASSSAEEVTIGPRGPGSAARAPHPPHRATRPCRARLRNGCPPHALPQCEPMPRRSPGVLTRSWGGQTWAWGRPSTSNIYTEGFKFLQHSPRGRRHSRRSIPRPDRQPGKRQCEWAMAVSALKPPGRRGRKTTA